MRQQVLIALTVVALAAACGEFPRPHGALGDGSHHPDPITGRGRAELGNGKRPSSINSPRKKADRSF